MKKMEVVLVDDIDGTTAKETVKFTYRGKTYEIDLNEGNLQEFDKCMSRFVSNARGFGAGSHEDREREDIRSWARKNGLKVGSRGRIPGTILREYYKASA